MNNIYLLLLFQVFLIIIVFIITFLYCRRFSNTKDDYLINITVLERVIDDYVAAVLEKNLSELKKNYNLDPGSPINSIQAFNAKKNEIISKAVKDIISLLTKENINYLRRKYSDNALALLIVTKIMQQI